MKSVPTGSLSEPGWSAGSSRNDGSRKACRIGLARRVTLLGQSLQESARFQQRRIARPATARDRALVEARLSGASGLARDFNATRQAIMRVRESAAKPPQKE